MAGEAQSGAAGAGNGRIHFGSIEEQLRASKRVKLTGERGASSAAAAAGNDNDDEDEADQDNGVNLEDLEDASDHEGGATHGLSESSIRAREGHQAVLAEFERKKRARDIAVPTDDRKVRAKLQELDEPQCLFGEGPADRRDRLRYHLSKLAGQEIPKDAEAMEIESEEEDEDVEEEFYTPGIAELAVARKWIAHYSLPRARERIRRQALEVDIPITKIKAHRKEVYERLKTYANWGSQIADDRPCTQAVFAPNSRIVATGSWSGLCKLWSVPDCKYIRMLRGHNDRVGGISFHPEATRTQSESAVNLASSGGDGSVYLWNLESETPIGSLVGHQARVARLDFHPSGRYLATASFDGTWRLWDVETQKELLLQEGHSREVYAISFQCDGALLVTGGLDAVGRVWDCRTGKSAMILRGHAKDILSLDWSPNGYQIASGSQDNTIRIWDVRALGPLYTIPAHNSLVSQVLFAHGDSTSPQAGTGADGLYLASAGYDGMLKVWSSDDWKLVKQVAGHEGKIMSMDVSQDAKFIVTAGYDRTFKLWGSEDMHL